MKYEKYKEIAEMMDKEDEKRIKRMENKRLASLDELRKWLNSKVTKKGGE